MTSSSVSSGDGEIALLVARGYSLDQATELHLQRVNNHLRVPAVPALELARVNFIIFITIILYYFIIIILLFILLLFSLDVSTSATTNVTTSNLQ
jgi:hypothetical protein